MGVPSCGESNEYGSGGPRFDSFVFVGYTTDGGNDPVNLFDMRVRDGTPANPGAYLFVKLDSCRRRVTIHTVITNIEIIIRTSAPAKAMRGIQSDP